MKYTLVGTMQVGVYIEVEATTREEAVAKAEAALRPDALSENAGLIGTRATGDAGTATMRDAASKGATTTQGIRPEPPEGAG